MSKSRFDLEEIIDLEKREKLQVMLAPDWKPFARTSHIFI